ncbi:MAG: hypothetical protein U9Q04_05100 [Campylobacterota bacterium]|nr:hypothetical protein [Campylobacterota bacterium]
MKNDIQLEISMDNVENLHNFSQIHKKDINIILNEALEQYFENEHKKLMEKNLEDENMMTNLDFNEFWDDVDI